MNKKGQVIPTQVGQPVVQQSSKGKTVALWVVVIILILIILVGGAIAIFYFVDVSSFEDPGSVYGVGEQNQQIGGDEYVVPDFTNVISYLEEKPLVQDLPSSGSVSLGFYHMNGDVKIWDRIYYITKGKAEQKQQSADVELWIHSDYVERLESDTICDIISDARAAGELGQSNRISTAQLLTKYSSMMSYRDCLGF